MFGFHSSKTQKEPQPDFASLVSEHALAAPEWEAELKKHDPFKTPPLPDKVAEQIWASRPPLNAETFARYWSNVREAGTAWQILHCAKMEYDRPALPMAYPNDPLGLYAWWHRDSLDMVEFLMFLEETFDIKIPDSVSEKIFNSFTLQETAQSLIELQTIADINRKKK